MGLNTKTLIATAAVSLAMLAANPASAAIYNISATDDVGTEIVLGVGQYSVAFIGIADGGAYDSAFVTCPADPCVAGWANRVSLRGSDFANAFTPGESTTVDVLSVGSPSQVFASAAASLAAYKSGPINHYGVDIDGGVIGAPFLFTTYASSPFTLNSSVADTYRLVVTQVGSRRNNLGGVSLSITAVPEPTSWALMIGGFGLAGAALRRRRAVAVG